jgi:intracellular sulfur oxidation DsrE/DsrF family protein
VLNADQALWVICFVGYAIGSILERGVNAGTPSMAGRDGVEVVICGISLGTYSTGWFVCFA